MSEAGTIRRAVSDDLATIAAVVNAWIDATQWMPRTQPEEAIEQHIREAFPKREIWVSGDPIDAYLSLDPEKNWIGALYCANPGRGTGQALLNQAKAGRTFLTLKTHAPNEAAHRFYRREGFAEVDRLQPEPPETVEEIVMEWRA